MYISTTTEDHLQASRHSATSTDNLGLSENEGTLLWGPYNEDPAIKGTILGSLFSETPICLQLARSGSQVVGSLGFRV